MYASFRACLFELLKGIREQGIDHAFVLLMAASTMKVSLVVKPDRTSSIFRVAENIRFGGINTVLT